MEAYEPMLAHVWDKKLRHVRFPGYIQPKLDGMRCCKAGDRFFSRTGKPIVSVPKILAEVNANFPDMNLDGELYVPTTDFEGVISMARKTVNIEEDNTLQYWVYDQVAPGLEFDLRWGYIEARFAAIMDSVRLVKVPTIRVHSHEEVMQQFNHFVGLGFEGIMFRNADGQYEIGKRSAQLLKIKPSLDLDAKIVGFVEGIGKHEGRLGALECLAIIDGKEVRFNVGTGFDDCLRELIWRQQNMWAERLITIKYQNLTAQKVPRFPAFLRAREAE